MPCFRPQSHAMFPATVMWRNDLFHGLKFGGHPDALAERLMALVIDG